MDYFHYNRWMSVFLFDIKQIPEKHPIICHHFLSCKFSVKKKYCKERVAVNSLVIPKEYGQDH